MKLIAGALIVLGLSSLGAYVSRQPRSQTFILPSTLKQGWVTIEYNNPTCPPLNEGWHWQEHVIPESGYLCTSSQKEMKLAYYEYFLVDVNGERTPLSEGKDIFKSMSLYLNPTIPTCKLVASAFWYGPQEAIDNKHNVVLQSHHPECVKGLETPIK